MSFRLSKQDGVTLSKHIGFLKDAKAKLEHGVEETKRAIKELLVDLNDKVDTYNEKLEEAREFIKEHADDWRGDYDDKSERWQEGDAGQEALEFVERWEDVDLNQVERFTLPDLEIEPAPDGAKNLELLPMEAGS